MGTAGGVWSGVVDLGMAGIDVSQLAGMMLFGEVKDGDTVHVSAGADGLIVGDRVSASNRPKPDDAVVH